MLIFFPETCFPLVAFEQAQFIRLLYCVVIAMTVKMELRYQVICVTSSDSIDLLHGCTRMQL